MNWKLKFWESKPAHTFSAVTPVGSDYASWNALVGGNSTQSVSRSEAISVPAVKRARDLITNLGSLPIKDYRDSRATSRALFDQPESTLGFTRTYTLANTIDDLFFHGSSLWIVKTRDYTGYPTSVQRIAHGSWSQDENGVIRVGSKVVEPEDAILFLSSVDPFLKAGARVVKTGLLLAAAANKYIDRPELTDYFTSADAPDEEEIREFLLSWEAARHAGTTGFLPDGIEHHEVNRMTPEELQLISAREFVISEVSRLTGISPTWLAVPVTTRTYTNAESENLDFLRGAARPYIAAIEERLSLGDVTPNGHYAKIVVDGFLRADTMTRYQSYAIGLEKGFLTLDEVRRLEDREPLSAATEGRASAKTASEES